ncbi:ribonuclease H-like domain-containing protein [Tanacetum coccineum]
MFGTRIPIELDTFIGPICQRKDGVTIKNFPKGVCTKKLPVLKTGEYDLWSMRMEQYLTFTDHALWEVIVNGDSVTPVASASAGSEGLIPPKTVEQKLDRKNELKAKSTLMLAIACKDAKSLWEAIKNRFGGNKESKKILVAQGYTQEEGIDYDEVFAPVARIEAIRLFLAYASFMGVIVYQMDVKSVFIYRTIEDEVYVSQPPSFEDP